MYKVEQTEDGSVSGLEEILNKYPGLKVIKIFQNERVCVKLPNGMEGIGHYYTVVFGPK